MVSGARMRGARLGGRPGLPPAPGQRVAGVFEVERLLGEGASGAVYRVMEADSGNPRALKIFSNTANIEQTLHEFRVLSRLEHAGCVKVHAFGNDANHGAYLVMDLIEGTAPTEVLPRGESPALNAFTQQILETLAYLHSRGVVHGDLKPANVRCIDGDPTRPVLLDFGLASTRDTELGGGTVLYMAPELFRKQPRDARSDLYALGIMLYEIVAGAPPYEGSTPIQIIRGHMGGAVRPLRKRTNASDAVSRLVETLMSTEPGARPASAHEALGLLAEVTGAELVEANVQADPAMVLSTPALTGRDAAVASFDNAVQAARQGSGSLIVLHGAPGTGRTRLLEELDVRSRIAGVRVIRWDPGAGPPASALSSAIRQILREQASEDVTGLVDGLRRIARLELETTADVGVSQEGLLDRLADVALDTLYAASRRLPLALLVDDVTSGGPHAPAFVARLARGIARSRIVLAVACKVPEDVPPKGIDRTIASLEELRPLESAEIASLVRTALGEVSGEEELASWLRLQTGGIPSAIIDLLHWLLESGVLARRKGRWFVTQSLEMTATRITTGSAIAARRLEHLDIDTRRFLRAASVMGMGFDPQIAGRAGAVAVPSDEDLERLLRNRLLVTGRGDEWQLRFAQRAVQTLLATEVAGPERRTIHSNIARLLLEESPDRSPEALEEQGLLRDVAWHLLGAGDWQNGVPLVRAAAEKARRAMALGEAAQLYGRAMETLENHEETRGIRAILLRDSGDLQMEADHPKEALELYERALELAGQTDPVDALRRKGHTLVRLGRHAEAIAVLAKVVSNTKAPTESRVLAAHDIGWAYMLHGDWAAALSAANSAAQLAKRNGDDRLRAQILKLRGNILWQQGQWDESLRENEAALTLFERIADHHGAAEALMAMGTAHGHLARYQDAIRCFERALTRFEEFGDRRGQGKCQNNLGIVHYYQGDWPAATERFEAFLSLLERSGERVERANLLNNLGSIYRERGMFDRAEQLLTQGLDLATELGTGRIETMVLGNLGETFVRAGRHQAAQEMLQRAIAKAREIEATSEEIESERRLAELRMAEDAASVDPERLEGLIEWAEDANCKLEGANLNRILASLHRARGRYAAALAALERGEAALADSGAALETARLKRERGLLLGAQGKSEAAQRILEEVEQTFSRMDAGWDETVTREAIRTVRVGPSFRSQASHLEAIAAFCQQIGSFSDQREFLQEVLERIMDLVSADRGFIVLFDEGGRPSVKVVHRREDYENTPADRVFSRTITRDAFRSSEPIFVPVTATEDRYKASESVAIMDVGSVVAASIRSHRRRRGVIYLDSRTPNSEELRNAIPLIKALSGVIGASLEHAQLLELERSRSETMAMLAHELRGPLNSIYAHLELSLESTDQLSDELREYLDVASSELLRLNRMIGNLTDLARLEHHSSANTVVSINIHELLATVVASLAGLWRARGQTVNVSTAEAMPLVLGSRDRVIQVVTNLLTNAVKFTPEGGAIRVGATLVRQTFRETDVSLGPEVPASEFLSEVQSHVSDSGYIRVSVIDSGPGIPQESLEHIFGKFRQSGESRYRKAGLGLGLAIARHIVERHGGRIWCDNHPDGGAAFHFTLPTLED